MYHAIAVQCTTPPGQVTCKTTAVRTAGWVPEVRCEILASWMLGKTNKQTKISSQMLQIILRETMILLNLSYLDVCAHM